MLKTRSWWYKIDQFDRKWSTMIIKHFMNGDSNIQFRNKRFGNKTWLRAKTLFNLNMFAISAVEFICTKVDFLVIWDLMTLNNHRLILHNLPQLLTGNLVSFLYLMAYQSSWVILFTLFTNPSARAGYDTRSIFKRSLTGLNSEFSFS